jgi:RNA polymerase sigma-70 factor (ECF subfamily)
MNGVEPIWKEYHGKLLGFIRARVSDAAVADDILQNVFVKIHAKLDTLRDDGKIQAWLYQITRNAIIDFYRSHKNIGELPESLSAPEPEVVDTAKKEISRCVLPLVKSLPDHYSQAVMMSEIEGLTQKEVAQKQGLSLSGAKARVQRGRAMMKNMLKECCRFEFDRRGSVIDYRANGDNGSGCGCRDKGKGRGGGRAC